MRSKHLRVTISLDRVRCAAERIRARTGVPVIAVIKADAYGLGAARVVDALASVAHEFAYFSLHEAREVARPGLVLGPPEGESAHYRELGLRPTVFDSETAARFAGMPVAISVDTGMQRFGCAPERVPELLARCRATELFSHTVRPAAAERLSTLRDGRDLRLHVASSALLDSPEAWLDAVRPGLALYRGAVRVSGRLVAVRETNGPAGYTGFNAPRIGIVMAGYAHRLQPAPVLINGRRQRLLEIGMNSSFVSVDARDRVGDEVVLLGDELPEAELARHLGIREHEVLCRYASAGVREYAEAEPTSVTIASDVRSCLAATPEADRHVAGVSQVSAPGSA
jgi:alanine racemase